MVYHVLVSEVDIHGISSPSIFSCTLRVYNVLVSLVAH
jgi:hypothetical protein